MARFCICGCGKQLLTKDGATDYDRKFFSAECLKLDRKLRMRDQRAQMKTKNRCNKCTQPILPAKTWEKIRQLAADAGIRF